MCRARLGWVPKGAMRPCGFFRRSPDLKPAQRFFTALPDLCRAESPEIPGYPVGTPTALGTPNPVARYPKAVSIDGELRFSADHDFPTFSSAAWLTAGELIPGDTWLATDLASPEFGVVIPDRDVGAILSGVP